MRRGLRGAATQPPFDQFPTQVPLSPRKITPKSPSDRTSRFPFASLPRFASRRQLGSRGLYAPGSSGAVTQPPSVSSPSEWLSLLAKSTFECPSDRTSRFPLASLPRFASRRRLGARWLITPGCSGAATQPPLVSSPSEWLSLHSQKHSRIACRPPLPASCRRTYSVFLSEAHGAVDYGGGFIGGAASQTPLWCQLPT